MGAGASAAHDGYADFGQLTKNNAIIDRQIAQDRQADRELIKLLLLGPGECGKSTLLKQMRILHSHGFTDKDFVHHKELIRENTIEAIMTLLSAMNTLETYFEDSERNDDAKLLLENYGITIPQNISEIPQDVADAIERIWADAGIQKCYSLAHLYNLSGNAAHFLNNIRRISSRDYEPTQQEILLSRKATCGIVELRFEMKDKHFLEWLDCKIGLQKSVTRTVNHLIRCLEFVDVGGQRTQRRKWIHCFDNVNSIIYIAAISEYNQSMRECPEMNRLVDSIRLFGSLANSRWFRHTHMILFLNKIDLFLAKIEQIPITRCFPQYSGAQTFEESVQYIEERFRKKNRVATRNVYMHRTCATDTKQMEAVLDCSIDMIINEAFRRVGLS